MKESVYLMKVSIDVHKLFVSLLKNCLSFGKEYLYFVCIVIFLF